MVKPYVLNAAESIMDGSSPLAIAKEISNLTNGLKIKRCVSVLIARLISRKARDATT